jgi:hypothetical protein
LATARLIAVAPELYRFIQKVTRMTMYGENGFVVENDKAVPHV